MRTVILRQTLVARERPLPAGCAVAHVLAAGVVHRSPRGVSRAFELGMAEDYRSHVVAGVPDPPSADEVVRTIDEILTGLYTGDMDIAMERCAAFAHVVALGIRTDYARSAGQDGAVPGSP